MSNDKLAKIEGAQPQALAHADPYSPGSFQDAWRLAQVVVKSRLAPGIESADQAFVVLATGHELGLSPMQSLRGIHNIKGRPCPSADTLVAVCLASGKADYFREVSNDGDASTWETRRSGGKPARYTFTIADAQAAELLRGNGNWKKYPKRMLAARAKAFLARDVYPDLVLGLYTPEEITDGKVAPEVEPITVTREPDPEPPTPPPAKAKAPTVDVDGLLVRLGNAMDDDALAGIRPELAKIREGKLVGADDMQRLVGAYKDAVARIDAAQDAEEHAAIQAAEADEAMADAVADGEAA